MNRGSESTAWSALGQPLREESEREEPRQGNSDYEKGEPS